jgi:Holliday junction DNA helicase RuvA
VGERTRLLTHLVVREDAHVLYGFRSRGAHAVSQPAEGVGRGPRIALAILSGGTAASFARAVREAGRAALTRIPGVGRKIAERLIVEMRDRIDDARHAGGRRLRRQRGAIPQGPEAEAYGALVALGYKPVEATRLLKGWVPRLRV